MALRTSVALLVGSIGCLFVGCAAEQGAPPQEVINQQMNAGQEMVPDEQLNQAFKASDHFAEYDQNADGKLTEKEIEGWMEKDPIDKLVQLLTEERGELTAEEWAEMDKQILTSIEASVDFAKASPFPKPEAALDDVFAG